MSTIGAATFSISGIGNVSGSNGQEYVRIPDAYQGNEVISWKKVPFEWYEQKELANQVADSLSVSLRGNPNVARVALTSDDNGIDKWNFLKVQIELIDPSEDMGVPNQIDGINISVKKAKQRHQTLSESGTGCENRFSKSNIPGGFMHESNSDGSGKGTTTAPVTDGSKNYMLAAAHIFGTCSDNILGSSVYQSQVKYGEVTEKVQSRDWAVVDKTNSDFTFENNIHIPGDPIHINGYLGRQSLEDKMANESATEKVGISTGHSQGVILSITSNKWADNPQWGYGCVDFSTDGVRVSNNQARGDSGAPVYEYRGWACYMISIGSFGLGGDAGYSCNSQAYEETEGWPAYKFVENTKYVFNIDLNN